MRSLEEYSRFVLEYSFYLSIYQCFSLLLWIAFHYFLKNSLTLVLRSLDTESDTYALFVIRHLKYSSHTETLHNESDTFSLTCCSENDFVALSLFKHKTIKRKNSLRPILRLHREEGEFAAGLSWTKFTLGSHWLSLMLC